MPAKRRRASSRRKLTAEEDAVNGTTTDGHAFPSSSATPPAPDALISPTTSLAYWSSTPPTISGMLGGFPQVSRTDIAGSRAFLAKLRRLTPSSSSSSTTTTITTDTLPAPPQKLRLVADCGAGIGRITTNLLVMVAEHIDVVEPIVKFTDELRSSHPDLFSGSDPVIGRIFNVPLENWLSDTTTTTTTTTSANTAVTTTPAKQRKYDLIWNQWALSQLPDLPLKTYLSLLPHHLCPGGWIVVKENVSSDAFGNDFYDPEDSSVTRTKENFERIFSEAGLVVRRSEMQGGGFGRGLGLLRVRMWGLQPKGEGEGNKEGDMDVG